MAKRTRIGRTWKHCDRTTRLEKVRAIALAQALCSLEGSKVTKLHVIARAARILGVSWRTIERTTYPLTAEERQYIEEFVATVKVEASVVYA